MKRILHILGSLNQGGAETYILRYMNFDHDNEHYVLCHQGITGPLEPEYRKRTKRIITNIRFYYCFGNYIRFIKFLKKEGIDTIWNGDGSIMFFLAKIAGVKNRILFYRTSAREIHNDRFYIRRLYSWLNCNLSAHFATRVLSNSQTALDNFHPNHKYVNSNKYKVIYNGIDCSYISQKTKCQIREMLGIPINAFVVGHSGRLNPAKNHEMIIKTAISLCRQYDDIYFVLMGLNVDTEYQKLIDEEELQDKIRLLGYRKDVMDILQGLDLFFFPSIREGNPNALIEAMVSGIPIVASNINPIIECVPNYLVNQLVSPSDFNKNKEAISCLYLHRDKLSDLTCAEWAKKKFDAETQFLMFKKELEA